MDTFSVDVKYREDGLIDEISISWRDDNGSYYTRVFYWMGDATEFLDQIAGVKSAFRQLTAEVPAA